MNFLFVGLENLDGKPATFEHLAGFRNVADFTCNQSGNRREIVVFDFQTEQPLDFADFGRAENVVITFVRAFDNLDDFFVLGVFVLDFADNFFDDVFDRDESGDAAVFVDDDGELNVARLHIFQKLSDGFCFGNKKRRSQKRFDSFVFLAFRPRV